jgi:hypothetical protein
MRATTIAKYRRRILAAALALSILLAATAFAAVTWKTVKAPAPGVAIGKNSHATATAWLLRHHGVARPGETPERLASTAWVYLQRCDCDLADKPIMWEIAEGLPMIFAARDHVKMAVRERCRYSSKPGETATFQQYVDAIKRNQPVILTFCYDPKTREGLATAKRRVSRCVSVAGIGYVRRGGEDYLICRDGLAAGGPDAELVKADRLAGDQWGADSKGKPWRQPHTSLYRWNGSYQNLVMVFVGE